MCLVALPGGSLVKNLPANVEDVGSVLGWRRSPGEGTGSPLQYPCIGNPMDRERRLAGLQGVSIGHDLASEHAQAHMCLVLYLIL